MTTTMNTGAASLLPCPFCGSAARLQPAFGNDLWWVACATCDFETNPRKTREATVASWNRRTTPQADAAPIINGHAINDLFLKWSEWTTELGEAISRKNIDGFVSQLRAAIAAGGAQEAGAWHGCEPHGFAADCSTHTYAVRGLGIVVQASAFNALLSRSAAPLPRVATPVMPDDTSAFKNFHRQLCERFGYVHDEKDWRRDQVSLIEWIAKRLAPAAPSVEQDERGAFDKALMAYAMEFSESIDAEKIRVAHKRVMELFESRAASTSANVAQLDMSLEARLTDAEADVKRLHAEKMELWNQVHGYSANVAQGSEAVAWFTDDSQSDKSATTWDRNVAERWRTKGWPVSPLYAAPPAQTATTVTRAMVKAAIPWLTGLHHMRNTDAKAYIKEAIKAALTAAQSASGDTK